MFSTINHHFIYLSKVTLVLVHFFSLFSYEMKKVARRYKFDSANLYTIYIM